MVEKDYQHTINTYNSLIAKLCNGGLQLHDVDSLVKIMLARGLFSHKEI